MNLDEHFPRATREQRAAIEIYHDAGWTIEPMSPDSDEVEIRDNSAFAWVKPGGGIDSGIARILPCGKVVTQ